MRAVSLRRRLAPLVLAGAWLGLLLAPPGAGAAVSLQQVGPDFDQPVQVVAPPGDGTRLMVVEQGGAIRVIRDGQLLATPFLKLTSDLDVGGERGLLSLAFPPDYERTRFVYAYYTDATGDIRVDQFRRAAGSRDQVEAGYRRNVIMIPHSSQPNHNGGTVTFGPDGHMYLGTGDGGSSYDQPDPPDAPNTASYLGKLLRIDPLPGGGYRPTVGNPFGNAVFAYGLRNPYRYSFDRANGDLTIGDVGQNTVEEIDHVPSSLGRGIGVTFGWDTCEGNMDVSANAPGGACTLSAANYRRPVIAHPQSDGYCAITGGVVVRDRSLEALYGRYVFGDLCKSHLRSAQLAGGAAVADREETSLPVTNAVDLGEDACGRVYVAEHGSGEVSRLRDETPGGCALRVSDAVVTGRSGTLTARALSRQRVLKRKRLGLRVACSTPCSLRVLGTLSIVRRHKRRSLRMKQVKRRRISGKAVVYVPIGKTGRRHIRRTLRAKKKVVARLTVRSRDATHKLNVVRLRVRVIG
jgi:glucose/arabinose dehydrogenase